MTFLRPETDDAAVVSDLHLRYGRVFELRGDYGRALEVYRELERIAKARGDAALEGAALSAQAVIFSNPTPFVDPDKAFEILERQIGLARERADDRLLAKLLWNKAQSEFWRGHEDEGIAAARESEALARKTGDKEQLAFTLNSVGQLTSQAGRTNESEAPLRESIALFEELGNKPMTADGWSTLGFTHFFRGELEKAGAAGLKAFEIADSVGNDWGRAYSMFTPGFVWLEHGDVGRAIETFESGIAYGIKGGFVAGQVAMGSMLGLTYSIIGAHDRAQERFATVVQLAKERLPGWYAWPVADAARAAILRGDLGVAERLLAEVASETGESGRVYLGSELALARSQLALATGDAEAAARLARAGRALVERRGLVPFEKDFDLAEAEASLRLGDLAAARAAAERGIEASRRQGSVRLLWALHGALAAVDEAEGHADAAARAREEAATIVDRIARSLATLGYEGTFRAQPPVRDAVGTIKARA
jgi:tetratricopeptide (TPR) repeat protein